MAIIIYVKNIFAIKIYSHNILRGNINFSLFEDKMLRLMLMLGCKHKALKMLMSWLYG